LLSTAGGRFPRAWLEPPRSQKTLAAGSQDSCFSRRNCRLSFQATCFLLILLLICQMSWTFRDVPRIMVLGSFGTNLSLLAGITAFERLFPSVRFDQRTTFNMGATTLDMGTQSLNIGTQSLNISAQPLNMGAQPLNMGAQPLNMGTQSLNIDRQPL